MYASIAAGTSDDTIGTLTESYTVTSVTIAATINVTTPSSGTTWTIDDAIIDDGAAAHELAELNAVVNALQLTHAISVTIINEIAIDAIIISIITANITAHIIVNATTIRELTNLVRRTCQSSAAAIVYVTFTVIADRVGRAIIISARGGVEWRAV